MFMAGASAPELQGAFMHIGGRRVTFGSRGRGHRDLLTQWLCVIRS